MVFVDTSVIVYSATQGPYRRASLEILDGVASGAIEARTSTAIIEEVWHIELSGRAGDVTGLTRHAYALFTPLLPVTDETVRAALALPAGPLGSNDRIHLATCHAHDITAILSADTDFDRATRITRIDPLDERRILRLRRRR
jgi:predicted nucleic acid-binding protein